MRLTSPAFDDGDQIPERYTADGEDLSVPLSWTPPPDGTSELALVMEDPDAPRPEPWVHWLLYHIPPDLDALDAGVPRDERPGKPARAAQGRNSWGSDNLGYRGPAPPPGDDPHHYYFTLYALDDELDLAPGAGRDALDAAMEGHILATAELSGIYGR